MRYVPLCLGRRFEGLFFIRSSFPQRLKQLRDLYGLFRIELFFGIPIGQAVWNVLFSAAMAVFFFVLTTTGF